MANDTSQINPGSNAGDFQPTTNNPQQIGGSNVQSSSSNLQPVQATDNQSGTQLYQQAERQPNLSVQTDVYSANSLVSVQPEVPRSNNGLLSLTGALFILLVVLILVRRYWQNIPVTPADQLDEAPVEPVASDELPEAESITTPVPKQPAKKAKTVVKKKSTPRKKKRAVKKN